MSVRAADASHPTHLLTARLRTARCAQSVKKVGLRTESLSAKLAEKKAMTALQRSRWVEAGLEVFGLEGEMEQLQAQAAVRPPLSCTPPADAGQTAHEKKEWGHMAPLDGGVGEGVELHHGGWWRRETTGGPCPGIPRQSVSFFSQMLMNGVASPSLASTADAFTRERSEEE